MNDTESRRPVEAADVPDHGSLRTKRPYQRPGILSREVWEAVAGVCSGANAKSTIPPCVGPISS